MAAIRRTDTTPEIALRSALHAAGMRFRKDHPVAAAGLRVRPDVVFTRARVAVFVDGCFWHSCPEHGVKPKTNAAFWADKLDGNRKRDRLQDEALKQEGWTVVRVWEHESTTEGVGRVERAVRR